MMLRLFAASALLTTCVAALADPRSEAVVEDLVELRQAIGNADAFATDERQFAEAVRRETDESSGRPGGDWHRERQQAYPQLGEFSPRQSPGPHPRSWAEVFTGEPGRPTPPLHHPSPKHQLLRAAFALERIAHELEMADLGKEADAVRNSADELRLSARDAKTDKPRKAKDRSSKREKRERQTADAKILALQRALAKAKEARAEAEQARQAAQEARKRAEMQARKAEVARDRAVQDALSREAQ